MDRSLHVSEEESWHLAYGIFLFTLEALASTPEEACEAMGNVSTAWELKDDALAGRYVLGHARLSPHQEDMLQSFFQLLDTVPVNNVPGGSGLQPNLTAMRDSAWEPVCAAAGSLLEVLPPATEAHRTYLRSRGITP